MSTNTRRDLVVEAGLIVPGSLNLTYGDEHVTLDPRQPHDVYERNKIAMDELLARMARDNR